MSKQRDENRPFGLLLGAVFALLAGLSFWHSHHLRAEIFTALAVLLLGLGIFHPKILELPRRAWMRFAHALGWMNSRIILTFLYLVLITPAAVLARLFGWDPLRLKQWKRSSTAWLAYSSRYRATTHYEVMY